MRKQLQTLRSLLDQLSVEYKVLPRLKSKLMELSRKETDFGAMMQAVLEDMRIEAEEKKMEFLIIAEAHERDDRYPPLDLGRRYGVTGFDSKALYPNESLEEMIWDLEHAAQCGCDGCAARISGRIGRYQKAKNA